ncbi:MAG: septal ring lytic transglycosylase RlpA family protein [Flavobacteriaceae bacterium]|nr:septal ring lytic transglycosylase RlpA family protein [Flavobacteriaceae bacterium]
MPRCSDCNKATFLDSIRNDSVRVDSVSNYSLKLYKNNVHASYYHDKFNGRRTASGQVFDNTKLTAAHRKLKFGTRVLVTNTENNKAVIVTINDRGPFVKGREIDLSKKAFLEITHNSRSGFLKVKLEIIQE